MADAVKTKEKTTIFSLPTEIRNRIWHYALEDGNKRCTRKRNRRDCRWCVNRCPPYHEPAVLQVSRQVRSETQSVWYANATFYFHDGSDKLLEFLVFLGNHKTCKIKNLKDEPSFGKARFARNFLEEVYCKIDTLGIQLAEDAIEVTCHEGLRLLKTSKAKEIRITMRKSPSRDLSTTNVTCQAGLLVGAGGDSGEDEESLSDSTLVNSDYESDSTFDTFW